MTDYGPMYRLPWKSNPAGFSNLYRHLAESYSGRVLSFPTDGLNAFQGILHLLTEGYREEFFWALPNNYLEEALKWGSGSPGAGSTQRRNLGTHSQIRPDGSVEQAPFPSWSWTGWIGNNDISAYGSEWTGAHSLVFYCLKNHGRVERISEGPAQTLGPYAPGTAEQKLKQEKRMGRRSKEISDLSSFYDATRTVITEDYIPSHVIGSPLASVILCFWTSTATITVQSDQDGRVELTQGSHIVYVKQHASHMKYASNTTQSRELILCCHSTSANSIFCLVCSLSNGIAYREDIVEIHESRWQQLQTVWRPVVLG